MPNINFEGSTVVLILSVYGGVVVAASWLSMIIWAYRDMRARSRDALARLIVAVMVGVLTVPGLLIYIFLRPRETLSEAYERSLEEEALLQEIEEKPVCPTCRNHIHDDWQACPSCHTRLKKTCINCQKSLDLAWNLCPHCATPQVNYNMEAHLHAHHHHHAHSPAVVDDEWAYAEADALAATAPMSYAAGRPSSALEFVESND